MIAAALVAVLAAGLASLPTADLVERLREPTTIQAHAALLDEACERPLSESDLRRLLDPSLPAVVQVDGAHLAECAAQPALAGYLFESVLLSQAEWLAAEPDVGRRLHRALLSLPAADAVVGAREAPLGALVDAQAEWLRNDWLRPLMEGELPAPRLEQGEASRRASLALIDGWRDSLLAGGSAGLAALYSDGDHASTALWMALRGEYLRGLLAGEDDAVARAAAETLRQNRLTHEGAWRAGEARAVTDPQGPWAALLDEQPPADAARRLLRRPLASAGRLPPPPPTDDPRLLRVPQSPPMRTWVLGGLLLMAGLWLAAARRWPERRPVLFRLGAIAAGPALLLLVELALRQAGAPCLIDERAGFQLGGMVVNAPTFNPETVEGEAQLVVRGGDARPRRYLLHKPPGVLRLAVLGESSAFGADYLADDAFVEVLGRRLQQEQAGIALEVINAGRGGAVSDEILQVARELTALTPDVVVLYMGHNDLAPLADLPRRRGWSIGSMALRAALDRSPGARLLRGALPQGWLLRTSAPDAGYLDEGEPSELQRRATAALAEWVLRDNLRRMVRRLSEGGAAVVVAVQAQPTTACDPTEQGGRWCFGPALHRAALQGARGSGAVVVDVPAAFDAARARSPALPESTWFWDLIHPTVQGHAIIGEALAPAVAAALRRQ